MKKVIYRKKSQIRKKIQVMAKKFLINGQKITKLRDKKKVKLKMKIW
jgi:hypothetical protein